MLFLSQITRWQGKGLSLNFEFCLEDYLTLNCTLFYIYSILLDYSFNRLEDIWFTSASHLTLATIELLMDRLPEFSSIGMRDERH
jgi:hypothetical protein